MYVSHHYSIYSTKIKMSLQRTCDKEKQRDLKRDHHHQTCSFCCCLLNGQD